MKCERKLQSPALKGGSPSPYPPPGGHFEIWGRFTVNPLGGDVILINHCFAATVEMLEFIWVDFFSARLQSK